MSVTIFANEVIFPGLLFCVFVYFLIIRPENQSFELNTLGSSTENISADPLNDVYEMIIDNDYLQSQLEQVSDRQELVSQLIAIAASKGYFLTSQDIESSIQEHTQGSQADYVCLPIGCWRIS